ncbi:hypothetical protein [Sphingomonas psychrotolerans]|nr:hypothetical protein [Sphingomonas psychrotolerans]
MSGTGVLLSVATVYNSDLILMAFPLWCASWGPAQCGIGLRDHLAARGA